MIAPKQLLLLTMISIITPTSPAPAQTAPPISPSTPKQRMAHRLGQLARSVMAGPQAARPPQWQMARALLDQATTLDPADPQLWRLKIEALGLIGDRAALRAALSEYLKTSPQDDTAQLRLIDLLVADAQTAEQRLAIYQRLIGAAQAQRLSPALRSRVALRAAILHRERGDTAAFGQTLKQAINLDPTNHDAALEAYRFLQQQNAPPIALAQALLGLLAADPSNGDVHAQVAQMMFRCGQYEQAVRWFDSASQLWAYQGLPGPARVLDLAGDWAMALWGSQNPDEALAFIQSFSGTADPANPAAAAGQAQAPADAIPVGLQSIVVAILTTQGRAAEAEQAFHQLTRSLTRRADAQPDNPNRLVDLIWAHLLFNQAIDQVPPLMARLTDMMPADDPLLTRLRGWLMLRQGNTEEARNTLSPLAEQDMVALFGLSLLGDANDAGRVRQLNRVYAQRPGGLIGLLAAHHIQRLGGRPQPYAACLTIARLAEQLPQDLNQLPANPRAFVILRPRPIQPTLQYAQPVEINLELTNVSGLPLSLGLDAAGPGAGSPGGTIPSRVVILTEATVDGQPGPALPPHVVDLGRHIRLSPGESLTVTTRIDTGPLADLLLQNPTKEILLQSSAILNPRIGRDGSIMPGLIGLQIPLNRIQRPAWSPTPEAIDRELTALQGDAPQQNPAAAMKAAALLAHTLPALPEDRQPPIVQALNTAYQNFTPTQQAWLVSHLPTPGNAGNQNPQRFAPIFDAAVKNDQPLLQYTLLASQVQSADSPLLNAALRRPPGPIRDFARQLRDHLQSPQPTNPQDDP